MLEKSSEYQRIAEIVVGLPIEGPFDYQISLELVGKVKIGSRVSVSFNRRKTVGYVVGLKQDSDIKRLNTIIDILDPIPVLSEKELAVTKEISCHYGCSFGEAIQAYLPNYLKTTIKTNKLFDSYSSISSDVGQDSRGDISLIINSNNVSVWEKLIGEIEASVKNKRSVIFLLPDKKAAKEIFFRIKKTVDCLVVNSAANSTAKKEFLVWLQIKQNSPIVVVGTRSTVFAPVSNLGLIVVYDEESQSYKQEQTPHYNAGYIALMRNKHDGCRVFFVSSAPSVETYFKAKKDKWNLVVFEKKDDLKTQVLDMSNFKSSRSRVSIPLLNDIINVIDLKGKVILFMNRRGLSSMTTCSSCGHVVKCDRCDVNLTYLFSQKKLVCRHCNFSSEIPKICPNCSGDYLRSLGLGVEKVQSELVRYNPQYNIFILDKDTDHLPKKWDILICTQAILEYKEKLKVELVSVLNFDEAINGFDYRSSHKAFSLLMQLRQMAREKMVIQTFSPYNDCIKSFCSNDYDHFYSKELIAREELDFPPYKKMIRLHARGLIESEVFDQTFDLYNNLQELSLARGDFSVSDVHPDIVPKLRDKFRFTINIKAVKVEPVLKILKDELKKMKKKRNNIFVIDVDY